VTHIKRLHEAPQHLIFVLARIEPLIAAGKLGPLLCQLPPTFKRDDERLAEALEGLPRTLRHAFGVPPRKLVRRTGDGAPARP
jgi:uncharacterized protein YecE (DUF72 family)